MVEPEAGVAPKELAERITRDTGLQARTRDEFKWMTISFYLKNTGIPFNFGITVLIGFIVGVAIAGQTFYLFTIENLKQFGSLKAMGVCDTCSSESSSIPWPCRPPSST